MTVSTVVITGTWLKPTNVASTGYVEFTPVDDRFINDGKVIEQETVTATLDGAGAISITLVRCGNGYTVKEVIDGVSADSYVLPDGAGPINLNTHT
jgi:hypothetical protein